MFRGGGQLNSRLIENVFVIFALLFGLIFTFITPPFQSVDEHFHFFRAYGISSKQLKASVSKEGLVGSELPVSLLKLFYKYNSMIKNINEKTSLSDLKSNLKIKSDKDIKTFICYPNTALYSPIAYLAQSFGINTGNLLNLPPLILIYLGRIFNLLLYTILGYYAIKVIPIMKPVVFLILLMPMNISLAASLSADALLITIALLFTAMILKYVVSDDNISNQDFVFLSILMFISALIKHHFFLFPLLFLIPRDKFGCKYWLKLSLIVFPAIIGCIFWSKLISDLYVPLREGADMFAQLSFIIHNPLTFILILLKTILVKTFRIIITMIGVLGWQDTRLDFLTYFLYPIMMIYATLNSSDKKLTLSKSSTVILSLTLLTAYLLIITYMYLSWSLVASNIVTGLNGKYFITLLLPLLILIASKIKIKFKVNNYAIYIFCFLILSSAVFSILVRFYNVFPNLYYQI